MVGKIYSYDEFMSKILKKHVYQLMSIPDNNQIDNKEADFIYCRTSSKDFRNHNKLINLGFDIIDVNVKFKRKFKNNYKYSLNTNTRKADKYDEQNVKIIAEKSFIHDRLHKDQAISNILADSFKKNWVANYFRGIRGDNLLVSEINNSLAGFILLIENNKEIIIDLIGVGEKYRQKGVGKNLIQESFSIYSSKKKDFTVSTQISNIGSMNFYKKLGFCTYENNFIWHWHKHLSKKSKNK